MEELISISKACKMLGVSAATMRLWDRTHKLSSIKTKGGHRRYRCSEIESLQFSEGLSDASQRPFDIEASRCQMPDNLEHWRILRFVYRKKRILASGYDNYFEVACKNCNLVSVRTLPEIKLDKICKTCLFLPKGRSGLNRLYHCYKQGAKQRKLVFELSKQELEQITSSRCHYCGSMPSKEKAPTEWGKYVWNGIDRKDNSLGYTVANSLPCCLKCNWAKAKMTYEEFVSYLDTLVQYRKDVKHDV